MSNKTSLMVALMDDASGKIDEIRKDALNTELKTHEIDTCLCGDTGQWETGIKSVGKSWIIVEQYNNKEEAIKGHKKWVASMKKKPKQELKDVMEYGF